MAQQITDADALAILQSTQASPASSATSSGITDPDAMAVLQSAQEAPHWTPEQQAVADQEAANGRALFAPTAMDRALSANKQAGMAEWHYISDPLLSAAQMLGHGIQSAADAAYGPPDQPGQVRGGVAGMIDTTARNFDQRLADREAAYKQSQPDTAASHVGAAMGMVAPFVVGGPASLGGKIAEGADYATQFANKFPLLQKMLSGGLQGSVLGSLQPVTQGDFAQQKTAQTALGTAAGGVFPLIARAGQEIYNAGVPLVNPMGAARDFVGRVLGDAAPQVAQNLRSAPTLVPGSLPTAAQVGQSIPLVQAEKALANQSPEFKGALAARGQANNQARLDAIQNVAGTPQTLQAAQDARRTAIDPFVSQYLTDSKPGVRWQGAQDAFQTLVDNPGRMSSGDFDALSQANKIAAKVRSGAMQEDDALAELKDLGDSVTSKKAQDAFHAATGAINRNMVDPSGVLQTLKTLRYGPLGVNPQRANTLDSLISSVQGSQNINGLVGTDLLDAVRQETGKLARQASGQNGMAYGSANDSLVQAIDRVAPGYANYLGAYARASQPITDQRAASGILDRLGSVGLGADQRPVLTLSRYNSALNQANKGPFPLSPQAQDALGNVQKDLQREGVSNSVRTPGSDTDYNLNARGWLASKLYGSNFNGGGPAGKLVGAALGSVVPGIGTVGGYLGAEKLASVANSRVFDAVQKLMLNPRTMADELDKLAAKNPTLAKALGRITQQQAAYSAPQVTHQP
jgi:hypothetical protein